jgi:hypothetical protein
MADRIRGFIHFALSLISFYEFRAEDQPASRESPRSIGVSELGLLPGLAPGSAWEARGRVLEVPARQVGPGSKFRTAGRPTGEGAAVVCWYYDRYGLRREEGPCPT